MRYIIYDLLIMTVLIHKNYSLSHEILADNNDININYSNDAWHTIRSVNMCERITTQSQKLIIKGKLFYSRIYVNIEMMRK